MLWVDGAVDAELIDPIYKFIHVTFIAVTFVSLSCLLLGLERLRLLLINQVNNSRVVYFFSLFVLKIDIFLLFNHFFRNASTTLGIVVCRLARLVGMLPAFLFSLLVSLLLLFISFDHL